MWSPQLLDKPTNSDPSSVSDEWAIRSEFWRQFSTSLEPRRLKRKRRNHPLILSGYGVSLNVEQGALRVRNGLTHHPQAREEFRYFRGDLKIPQRIIIQDGAGTISLDALDWLHEQNIVLVRIGWNGKSSITMGGSGSPTDASNLKWQIRLESDPRERLKFAADLISKKLTASRNTLNSNFENSAARQRAFDEIENGLAVLNSVTSIREILATEGYAARTYFQAWRGLQLQWNGERQSPVPPMWQVFDQRSSLLTGKNSENWKASHPINAMLNYAYAVLEAETRIRILSAGYDPRIGILHVGRKREKQDSFVFDLMEPLRPVVDGAILTFVRGQTFSAKDFVLRSDGVCRLNPQLARAVAQAALQSLNAQD